MRHTRPFAPITASLGLIIILAACAPSPAAEPSPTSPAPTVQAPSESPEASPSLQPSPTPGEVVEFDLPMIATSTEDDVDVYARPSTEAPLLVGEQFPDMNRVEIRLAADERVSVTLGPLVSEGMSWYQVSAVDGGPTAFAFGWVSAEFLAHESDSPASGPQIATDYGLGSGAEINMDVPLMGTPITVDVAAAPTEDQETCELDVTLIRTDGLAVNVATQTMTEPDAFQLGATIEGGMPSLFQEEAGTVTLQVETNCNWAASLFQPPV